MAGAPALVLTVGSLFLPETPNSFIHRGNGHEKAKWILQQVRGTDDVQAKLDDMIEASNKSKAIKHPFKNITQRKYRPQLVMSIAIPFFMQVTGINVITFYAPVLFRTIGLGESASLMSAVVIGLVGTTTVFLSLLLVNKYGRRASFPDEGGLSEGYGILILILISKHVAGLSLSWGPLGWVVTGEIFPLEIQSAAQSINVATNFLSTILIAQVFVTMLCHLKYGIFFFCGGWVIIMTGFVYLFLLETKNIPIEKMDKIWREHYFWKRIVLSNQDHEENKIEGA